MLISHGSGDLCSRYRPRDFDGVVGQEKIVAALRSVPSQENPKQTFLFLGESGTGKTTLARILAMALNCSNLDENNNPCKTCEDCDAAIEGRHPAIMEIDATDQSGIGDVRLLRENLNLSPLLGKNKVLIIDECHMLSKAAQNGFLKPSEQPPRHVFMIFCSTDPKSIIPTLKNRCQTLSFGILPDRDIEKLLRIVATVENGDVSDEVVSAIVEHSQGRPRNALINLQTAMSVGLDNVKEVLSVIMEQNTDPQYIDLFKILMSPVTDWQSIVKAYKAIPSEPIRLHLSLTGWFRSTLERARKMDIADRASRALDFLLEPLPPAKPENRLVLTLYKIHKLYRRG